MELATPAFILQYDVRPNRLFIEYLKYPKEVFIDLMVWFSLAFSFWSGCDSGFNLVNAAGISFRKMQPEALVFI